MAQLGVLAGIGQQVAKQVAKVTPPQNTERLRNKDGQPLNRRSLWIWQGQKPSMTLVGHLDLTPKLRALVYKDRGNRHYYYDGRNIRRIHGNVT